MSQTISNSYSHDEFDQDVVFPLSFSNRSFMDSVPTLSSSPSDSLYSSSPMSNSYVDSTPALLSSFHKSYMHKSNFDNSNDEYNQDSDCSTLHNSSESANDDIFQLDCEFANAHTAKNSNANNTSANKMNFEPFYDAFANAAQQNYRIWASSV